VRLLVDANLSPKIAACSATAGTMPFTWPTLACSAQPTRSGQVIVSADTDFGELLAVSGATRPSVVLLRSADRLAPDQQAALLTANLPVVADEHDAGAVVSIARGRLRVRPLPVRRG
jgi:predicted nuclease of predicted toxin-antitoxin system